MTVAGFETAFAALAGNKPFPWQTALFERMCEARDDNIPASCNLPTGLGKTSVIHVWLLALARGAKVPRRLVYVVNRRTVVDQTTTEVEKLRDRLPSVPDVFDRLCLMCATVPSIPYLPQPLAISTLRGQFADNREWSADPARPAVICGTVDMIGSRLLFSGYGCSFKTRPLHAGFLGQDALIVHDEAHLEPAFQELLLAIEHEQNNDTRTAEGKWTRGAKPRDFRPLRVMELTATSRAGGEAFTLTDEDHKNATVQQRVNAKKALHLHELDDEKKQLAETITTKALAFKDSGKAVLVFARKVDDVEKIVGALNKAFSKEKRVQQLTGTLRGLERDDLPKDEIFARFLPASNRPEGVKPKEGTVYLVCTSAGEVGVNISADHLVCDLSTFESMAQRFGRVNRFGDCDKTEIHVYHPKAAELPTDAEEVAERKKEKQNAQVFVDTARRRTHELLVRANGDVSPSALGKFDPTSRAAAFSPQPGILLTSDILFDAWALTSVREKLPGRPPVEQYLHGIQPWQPPETHVAWREEVSLIVGPLRDEYDPEELLEKYPLKPHELLGDNSARVFDRLKKLKTAKETPVWLVSEDGSVEVTTLGELIDAGKDAIERKTVLLPPSAGGLSGGFLTSDSPTANDVSGGEHYRNERDEERRVRVWDDAPVPDGMRWLLTIDTHPEAEETDEYTGHRFWHWYELRKGGDDEGIKNSKLPVTWDTHTKDVVCHATAIAEKLRSNLGELADALIVAAHCHDLGKRRKQFQTVLGNGQWPGRVLAKSGKKGGRLAERYRHEFGSLLDAVDDEAFCALKEEWKAFVLHVIATHHGRGRPHFPTDEAFDPEPKGRDVSAVARAVPQRFGRLQRKYGRWGLAYLESLLRAADYAASAKPSEYEKEGAQ